jgi:hypothetical protein
MNIFKQVDDIFEAARRRIREGDPDTSFEAAQSVIPKLNEIQQLVEDYAISRSYFGFTDYELNDHFQHQGSTYRTRRSELTDAGIIVDSGRRKQRGDAGRKHIVWLHRDFK